MAYLGKARKEDLRLLAEELNLNVGDNMKISDLSKLITTHPDYDEDFSKNQLTIIIEDRKLREQQEMVLKQQEFVKEKERLDREFQLEKLRTFGTGMPEKYKKDTTSHNARSNIITAKGTELESTKDVVTARVSIPVSVPINTRNGIDDLQLVDIKCGQTSIKAVIDTGAQISVLREDLIGKDCGVGEGTFQIISAFGEKEITALKLFNLKIDDGKHGSVPIMCAVSKKLVNDMLISATAYEILLENVQLFDFENQRDFECTKDKDIQLESEEELSALALGQETETSETYSAKSSFVKLLRMDESLGPVWSQAKNKQDAYEIDD
ncbi:retrovirus-related Pol polyprotein from transposon 297 [Trichonephila clavata]|uniref:Retrovirus-related Pol polyprotein from transposon 297 n=1 Tax=Trichonephila clavata TaxID=2740835 RepID=A0A8X6GQD8_TRICU|nr:retrovirus-related Pol polyprotein from transposon 297 [Trichonephila clavata]